MPSTTVIRNAHTIVGFDAETGGHAYLPQGDIVIADGVFTAVGGRHEGPADSEIDGRDTMVLPGLVNIHCHSGDEPIAKGLFEDEGTAALWGNALYEYSSLVDITEDAVKATLTVMLGDLMASGVTTLLDIAGPNPAWIPTLADSGARAYLAPGFREAKWHVENSHRLDFVWDKGRGRDAFARALEVVDAAGRHESGRLKGIVAPAQVETCSPELLQEAAEAARARKVPITIHAAQTMAEHEELLRRTGLTAVQYLGSLGVLGPDLILGHGIFLDSHAWTRQRTEQDLDSLAASGTSIAHCPVTFARSGMILQSLGKYRRRGVNVGIGTDSYPFNMLEEMRQALICARIAGGSVFDIDTAGVFSAATLGGAQALGRSDIGRIAPGARADFVLVDLKQKGMQPCYDPLRNLLHCAAERAVAAVYVDGHCVSRNGKPTGLDYDGALAELQAIQDYAVRNLPSADPRGRSAAALARPSLPRRGG